MLSAFKSGHFGVWSVRMLIRYELKVLLKLHKHSVYEKCVPSSCKFHGENEINAIDFTVYIKFSHPFHVNCIMNSLMFFPLHTFFQIYLSIKFVSVAEKKKVI